jgi:hypothetical protein
MSNEKVIPINNVNVKEVRTDFEDFRLVWSELEVLATHYFIERLDYEYNRFAYPSEAISSQEWYDYIFAGQRLEAIGAVAEHKMAEWKKVAERGFQQRWKITKKNWAEFVGETYVASGCGCLAYQACLVCQPNWEEEL